MKKVITASAVEALLKEGKTAESIAENVVLTPSARDLLKSKKASNRSHVQEPQPEGIDIFCDPVTPDHEFRWIPGADPKNRQDIYAFYFSPAITQLREKMTMIGQRMWQREYTEGNGGNLSVRIGDNLVLCTPTLTCKGFMQADDMALVDLEGTQIAGRLKCTSEAMTHLAIMKQQPKAKACCYCHPPHATAFAVANVNPPTCLVPEAEIFLGKIGMAEYCPPGSPEKADEVGRVAVDHMSVIMKNRGVITWGKDVEDAFWKMETTESYCKTVWVSSQLGKELIPIGATDALQLIDFRKSLGMDDKRDELKECELCDNSDFRPGFFTQVNRSNATDPDVNIEQTEAEELVKLVTTEVFRQLNQGDCGCGQ